jgi:F0F1-type ATP synthase epsilon subunit
VEASSSSVGTSIHWYERLAYLSSLVSGGFAIVQPNSELSINAVEGYPLEDFSIEAVRSQISEAQKIVSGSGSEQDIAEAKIELEVCRIILDM